MSAFTALSRPIPGFSSRRRLLDCQARRHGFVEAENHASIEPLSPERRLSDAFATVRTAETLPSVEA